MLSSTAIGSRSRSIFDVRRVYLMKIHQFVHTLAFGDAISSEALTIQRILAAAGIPGEIVVVHRDSRFERQTTLYQDFRPEAGRTLVLHYSIASPLHHLFLNARALKPADTHHNR